MGVFFPINVFTVVSLDYRTLVILLVCTMGFPQSSDGKESTCDEEGPGSIPGWGRSTGERKGYPLQYSWASLVVQLIKNPPATWETWLRSLGWENLLEKGKATHSSILAWRIPWIKSMGSQRVGHDWATFTFTIDRVSARVWHSQSLRLVTWIYYWDCKILPCLCPISL